MNGFKADTKIEQVFETLSDLEPHCAAHEFPGSQPQGQIRNLRDRGYRIRTERTYCEVCGSVETHDQLLSLDPTEGMRVPNKRKGEKAPTSLDGERLRYAMNSMQQGIKQRDWSAVESGARVFNDYVARIATPAE